MEVVLEMVELGKEGEDKLPKLWSSWRLRGMGMSLPSWMYDGRWWGPIDVLDNPRASRAVTFISLREEVAWWSRSRAYGVDEMDRWEVMAMAMVTGTPGAKQKEGRRCLGVIRSTVLIAVCKWGVFRDTCPYCLPRPGRTWLFSLDHQGFSAVRAWARSAWAFVRERVRVPSLMEKGQDEEEELLGGGGVRKKSSAWLIAGLPVA